MLRELGQKHTINDRIDTVISLMQKCRFSVAGHVQGVKQCKTTIYKCRMPLKLYKRLTVQVEQQIEPFSAFTDLHKLLHLCLEKDQLICH